MSVAISAMPIELRSASGEEVAVEDLAVVVAVVHSSG